jgi:group I intron endonuclease
MPGIYLCKCLINDKIYIGQTCRNYKVRWDSHKYQSRTFDDHFHRAIRKYGFDNFEFQILHDNIDKIWLDDWEIYYIQMYNSNICGYNTTAGGFGTLGVLCTEEKKQKIREKQIGIPKNDETKKRMSIAKKGKPHTEKQIEARKNCNFPKTTKKAIPVSMYTNDGIFIKSFKTVKEAKSETGACDISSCCKGKRGSSKGYIWKYS